MLAWVFQVGWGWEAVLFIAFVCTRKFTRRVLIKLDTLVLIALFYVFISYRNVSLRIETD